MICNIAEHEYYGEKFFLLWRYHIYYFPRGMLRDTEFARATMLSQFQLQLWRTYKSHTSFRFSKKSMFMQKKLFHSCELIFQISLLRMLVIRAMTILDQSNVIGTIFILGVETLFQIPIDLSRFFYWRKKESYTNGISFFLRNSWCNFFSIYFLRHSPVDLQILLPSDIHGYFNLVESTLKQWPLSIEVQRRHGTLIWTFDRCQRCM